MVTSVGGDVEKCWWGCGETGTSYVVGENRKDWQLWLNTVTLDPAILLLGVDPREMKA